MPEKKCHNCGNMDFCAMYLGLLDMAQLLNVNLESHTVTESNNNVAVEPGFKSMVDHMAHNCKRFKAVE